MRRGQRTRDDLGEVPRVLVGGAPLDRHEHVDPVRAARLAARLEPERVERLLDEQRDLHRLGEADVGRGVEVEEDEVGPVGLVDARVPRVHVDAAHVDHPEQCVFVVDDGGVDPAFLRRSLARRDLHVEARDPLGHALRCVFLEERLAISAVGIATHRERPIAQVRDEHLGDRGVVVDQVALGDPEVGPEQLVEVGQFHLPLLHLRRTLPPHVDRRLVIAQPLEGGRAQVTVVRPLSKLDLGHEFRLDPDDVALLHLWHLRDDGERRCLAPERFELRKELLDVVLPESGTHVPDPLPVPAPVDAEHEGAEASAPPALALRVAADHEFLPSVRLDLQPVTAPLALAVTRGRPLGNHALEALLLSRLEKRVAVREGARELDDRVPSEQLLEPSPPFTQRQVDERLAVDLEHVEHLVREVRAPLLHRGEARLAVGIERHDLSVDDGVRRA